MLSYTNKVKNDERCKRNLVAFFVWDCYYWWGKGKSQPKEPTSQIQAEEADWEREDEGEKSA